MKLVIAGASGYVATECIRQALTDPRFTKVVALARREVKVPTDLETRVDTSKFHSVVIEDYGSYSDEVKRELAGADACVWTVAVTPNKASSYEWAEVVRVSRDVALEGLKVLLDVRGEEHAPMPLRFMYMSGNNAERDQTKSPLLMKKMCLMRGEAETAVLELAAKYPGKVEACSAKPGLIYRNGNVIAGALSWVPAPVPIISVGEVAAAMLDQLVVGFEMEPLMSHDLARIGSAVLEAQSK